MERPPMSPVPIRQMLRDRWERQQAEERARAEERERQKQAALNRELVLTLARIFGYTRRLDYVPCREWLSQQGYPVPNDDEASVTIGDIRFLALYHHEAYRDTTIDVMAYWRDRDGDEHSAPVTNGLDSLMSRMAEQEGWA